jgi:EmrB/QacA subfamily drug resistance transporter
LFNNNDCMDTIISPPGRPHRGLILAICCLSLLMVSMDATIVNVALPSIRIDLGASLRQLQWVIDAYTVVLASFLMLGGANADRYGRRRVFQSGMALFTVGSLLCSVAPSIGWLIAARLVQALGGSMLTPVAMSIVVHTFPEPKERARAIGIWGAVAGVAMALGPLAGGALTQGMGWHSIFWINVPIGLLAIVLAMRYVPESRAPQPRRPDPVGQGLLLAFLGLFTYSLIESATVGRAETLATLLLAAAAFVGILIYEPRRREPLLDLRFFRSLPFSSATAIAVCMFSGLGAFLFLNSLYLQEVRGLPAARVGLYLLPMAAMVVIVSPLSGRLVASHGARPSLLISGGMMIVSALLLTRLAADTPTPQLLMTYALFGLGFGMVNAPVTYAAVSGMPRAQSGLAAAVATTSRQVGLALGVAMAGTLVGGSRVWTSDAWVDYPAATHPVWWILVASGVLVLILGLLATGPRGKASAARVAYLLEEQAAGVSS